LLKDFKASISRHPRTAYLIVAPSTHVFAWFSWKLLAVVSSFQAARSASLRDAPLVRAIFFLARSCRRGLWHRKNSSRIFCAPKIATRSYVTPFRDSRE